MGYWKGWAGVIPSRPPVLTTCVTVDTLGHFFPQTQSAVVSPKVCLPEHSLWAV